MEYALIAAIAFVISMVSGMVGLGGAVLLIPAYLYLPGLFGMLPLDIKSISGLTSFQVLASSLLGMIVHRKRGAVDKRLVLAMGIPIVAASLTGALLSVSVEPGFLLISFGAMAVVGAALVLLRQEPPEPPAGTAVRFHVPGAVGIALGVGFFGGMVGAPGAFLLSPLMMTVLRIPTRITIGSTLGIVLLSALAASVGKSAAGLVPVPQTLVAVLFAIPGAMLGSMLSHRLPTKTLRLALAVMIAGVAVQIIVAELR